MRGSSALILATAASLLLHGVILGGVEWSPVELAATAEAPELQAKLVMLAPAAEVKPPPPAPPKPKAPPRPEPRPQRTAPPPVLSPAAAPRTPAADAAPAEPEPLPAEEAPNEPTVQSEPEPPEAEPSLAAAGELAGVSLAAWPRHGNIRFRTFLGQPGFMVGEARHEWWHDGERYRMSVELETTGLVGLVRDFRYVQRSEGRVGTTGLVPETFSVEQSRKTPASASFDWKAGTVTLRRGHRVKTEPIRAGDQDLLSLWHQIGIAGVARGKLALTVVSGRDATPSSVEVLAGERLRLPIGELDTVRVRAAATDGRLSIDIWLASAYGMLPVRIRIVDDKGEVLDQRAIELRLAPPPRAQAEDGVTTDLSGVPMIELLADEDAPLAEETTMRIDP